MRRITAFLIAAIILSSGLAEAEPITFALNGTVRSVEPCWRPACGAYDFPTHGVSVGTPWQALLTLDPDQDWDSDQPYADLDVSLRVEVGDYRDADALVSVLWVMDTWRDTDGFGFHGLLPNPEDSDLYVNWRWPATLAPTAPMRRALVALNGSSLVNGTYYCGIYGIVGSTFTADVTQMHPVPEPASVLLLGAGLGLGTWINRASVRKR